MKTIKANSTAMNSIAKTIRNPTRYIYKQFYSTSSDKKGGKMNVELSEILTDEEIDHEVRDEMKHGRNMMKSR